MNPVLAKSLLFELFRQRSKQLIGAPRTLLTSLQSIVDVQLSLSALIAARQRRLRHRSVSMQPLRSASVIVG